MSESPSRRRYGRAIARVVLAVVAVLFLAGQPAIAAADEGDGVSAPVPTTGLRAAGGCATAGAVCATDRTYTVRYEVTGGGSCRFTATVRWGDGVSETVTYGAEGFSRTHRYEKSGVYTVAVTGSGTSTTPGTSCTFRPSTTTVEVPGDRYRLEIRSWIPQATTVDPVHLIALPARTPDLVDACRDEIPDIERLPVTRQESWFLGDRHTGFDGSIRVGRSVEFDWDGTSVSNVSASTATVGTTVRVWRVTIRGEQAPRQCTSTGRAQPGGGGSGGGTSVSVDHAAANPLILGSPQVVARADATLSGRSISLRMQATGFPSHGFALYRNGELLRREVTINVACRNTTGPAGFGTVTAGLYGPRQTVVRQFSLDTSSGTGLVAGCR